VPVRGHRGAEGTPALERGPLRDSLTRLLYFFTPPPPGREAKIELLLVGLGEISCSVQCKEMIHDGLLNAAFFTRYRVSLDLAAKRAWVRPSS